MVHAAQDALGGNVFLPLDVALAFASNTIGPPTDLALKSTDVKALQLLCAGEKTEQIAADLGYSLRQTQRILRDLYRRMGVRNRTEAIIQATQWARNDT